ncbi:MAG: hypothetical protein QP950_03860 [Staphylococcus warneri]|uniref:hypothetical protein n=1 Tax=Staphylococcus warneri TaxID=1292 RepID=UPI000F5C6330|nr:hypothetical protein [Staphylococcus warneri]MCM3482272.1 hypothetical protein [Staphylococcus warneri]MCT1632282.1 hypothetical protein [Staphylococcus warneri]MCT2348241.1 hypothetical protein [Staphylococcus warneri]MCV7476685.1 hypothetical protein [Staphylococcus warneri]MDK8516420.1 hypothetical protein [Staphylococcus warneri]
MTYPTREQLEEYIRNNKLDTDESYPRSDWWKFKQQRDEYKQQRDELIKDIAQLRERNVEFEEKLDKEIKLSYEIEKNLYETSKERDELIKSNASVIKYNAELEKKAKAFDEIALTVLSEDNDVIKNMNNIVTKMVINNLEREE